MSYTRRPVRLAFTLIELLMVMVIIAILFCLVVGAGEYAKRVMIEKRTLAEMQLLEKGILEYQMQRGTLPASLSNIVAYLPAEGMQYSAGVPVDHWRQPYVYTVSGDSYSLFSKGMDTNTGTGDDIHSGR